MQILASFEPLKFRSEGRLRPHPRSRIGARPCQAAYCPDSASLTIDRDGISSSAFPMQASASLCGTTLCGCRPLGPGWGYRALLASITVAMQDSANGFRRIPLPRTRVHKSCPLGPMSGKLYRASEPNPTGGHCLTCRLDCLGSTEHLARSVLSPYADVRLGRRHLDGRLEALPRDGPSRL